MTTHVFVVDNITFPLHLEHLFAGTGAGDNIIDFNGLPTSSMNTTKENMLAEMIADGSRIRRGDYILFYLQQNLQENIAEGKFYGIFRAREDGSFLDNLRHHSEVLPLLSKEYNFSFPKDSREFKIAGHEAEIRNALTQNKERNLLRKFENENDTTIIEQFIDNFYHDNQYLLRFLCKSLTFRTLIEPSDVYSEGVTEWEALDEIRDIHSPNQMLWSLIYRKLKGNRGNTMITTYESERLRQLIRNKNGREILEINGHCLSFDPAAQRIFVKDQMQPRYQGRREELNILPRLLNKLRNNRAFEKHLQAYITINIGRGLNLSLDNTLLRNRSIEWIGNEVGCGVGMRKIDIMLSLGPDTSRVIVPVELKCDLADAPDVRQLERYVEWIRQYYIPNRQSDIEPVILSRAYKKRDSTKYHQLCEAFSCFNNDNNHDCRPLRYIEFDQNEDDLQFTEIIY